MQCNYVSVIDENLKVMRYIGSYWINDYIFYFMKLLFTGMCIYGRILKNKIIYKCFWDFDYLVNMLT